ncbi:MAG: hypothetical protein PHE86_07480 [Candidatus Marinimicrobia bacterium]|nr:hypothetical protein [Candidatus Neomarinimicrobiota bacterium]MDD5582218.1 hypothetical protein [Candidatus Neomarinimicrobiota bacterium]
MKKIAILLIIFSTVLLGRTPESMSNIQRFTALDVHVTNFGTGLGGYYQFSPIGRFHPGINALFVIVSGKDEYTWYDIYGYPHVENEVSLNIINLGVNGKYHLFKGKLANTFSPFISAKIDYALALDTPEGVRFTEKIKHIDRVNGINTGFFGGVDFAVGEDYGFSIAIGNQWNYFERKVDNQKVWDGTSIVIQYGKIIP